MAILRVYNPLTQSWDPIPYIKGDKGDRGYDVTTVEYEYYSSTSSSEPTGGEWSTIMPGYSVGRYIWVRTKTTNSHGEVYTDTPVLATLFNDVNSAELSRRTYETNRVNAETARDTAEGLRDSAEIARASAELLRVSAETSRGNSEVSRANAEAQRVSAESSRVSVEAQRVANEEQRISNENARIAAQGRYPIVQNNTWWVWSKEDDDYVDTEVTAVGADGVGIASIELTSTVDLVDTYTITFDDGNTTSFDVTNGADGISPTITVTEITGGHEVEVVDAEGTESFNVMDGLDGQSGLITDYIAEEKAPYLFRPSANGLANVISEKDMIVGGTVAWNQLVQNGNFSDTSNWTASVGQGTFTVQNNIGEITGVATNAYLYQGIDTELNHVFLFGCDLKATKNISSYFSFGSNTVGSNAITTSWTRFYKIGKKTATSTNVNFIRILNQSEFTASDVVNIRNAILIDLTKMFGSTIAEHLNTLETANTGDGIAKLKEWGFLTKSYYPYNSGDLMPVQTSAHVMRGFNQWDEEWELGAISSANGGNYDANSCIRTKNYIPVISGGAYYFKTPENMTVRYYDANHNYLGAYDKNNLGDGKNQVRTMPDSCCYIKFQMYNTYGTTYNHDICINISGLKNGQYEPYSVHSYPLDSDLVLRGTLKLDAQNNLYYDGDRYESNGTVTRKFGIIDLGSLTYGKSSIVTNGFVGLGNVPSDFPLAPNVSAIPTNWMTSVGYAITSNAGLESASVDKAIGWRVSGSNKGIIIKDSAYATYYTNNDMESFKSAMSGKYLQYGMVAPTTESADPYSEYQIVDADGTEEYVDERPVPIPVGHDTFYQQAVDVPQLPTTDGSYRLALSKTGNTATASWEYVAQAEMKAQTNIPSGKYFSVGERLFVSTQAIAQGASIVVGTNCLETTLADALNSINS